MDAMTDPLVIERADHPISRKDLDQDAIRILYRLKRNGYEAYVVGGAVRDLLRGEHPKDVDIATNARPWEIRDLFHNSRTIGRRFRIVHVFFGDKNIEVSTLRRQIEVDETDEDLYVEEDNAWGDVESDAFRRDFTVNALFYDINGFDIIDYVGGVDDIENQVIRCIGDPAVRFQEDPVRMLRAIKFAARFGFHMEAETEKAIHDYCEEILKASQPRVTEELFRIIGQRNGRQGLLLLKEFGFLDVLWPEWLDVIGEDGFEQVVDFFDSLYKEAAEGRFYPLEFIAAGLFLPIIGTVDPHDNAFQKNASHLATEIRSLAVGMDIPKRMAAAILTLMKGQLYLIYFPHRKKSVFRFINNPDYDWVWSLHELAFGHVEALHGIQEAWIRAADQRREVGVGFLSERDARDVFSFRGKTGGGRFSEDEERQFVNRRRSGGRRRGRRR